MIKELQSEEVVFHYNDVSFSSYAATEGIIGQEKAIKALEVGLDTDRNGYNLFLCGDFGTGRLTAVRKACEERLNDEAKVKDVLYLANPARMENPITLLLPEGKGKALKEAFASLTQENFLSRLATLQEAFPQAKEYLTWLSSFPFDERFTLVNVAIDRTGVKKRPFIIESHPSFENLFGWYEGKGEHMGIHVGSYGAASGGFLVLTAEELLAKEGLWDALKRHLDATAMALTGSQVLGEIGKEARVRPSPIPLATKVILLGREETYEMLSEKDDKFLRLFKVSPQFDYTMKASTQNIQGTVAYLVENAKKNQLTLDESAIRSLLRYSSWFAESREELTCQLSLLGDLIAEAHTGKQTVLSEQEIQRAIETRSYMTSTFEEKINNEIASGELIISVEGEKVGIVNGLAVMDRGLTSFGTTAVISATASPGSEGIVNIEHEAGLSGELHDKGILILEGYLRKMYARSFPLSLYAGICFEQNYSEVDGDSASSSELYALLSAIGELPLRQDIAVTGSVNQMGILQPVGGINEKITGFWKTCKTCGFTGKQGVIIPRANTKSLILPKAIEEDVTKGIFHIWALATVEEGMELLTGLKSGERDRRGNFPQNSFNRHIEERLRRLYEAGKGN